MIAWTALRNDAVPVPAQPTGVWTLVIDYVEGPCLLKIAVPGFEIWSYAPTAQCGPDGDLGSLLLPERCLYPKGPVGALIAKVGGSSAGFKDDGVVSLVGKTGIISVAAPGGPLYLTINDELTGMANNAGTVNVLVWSAPAPAASIDTSGGDRPVPGNEALRTELITIRDSLIEALSRVAPPA